MPTISKNWRNTLTHRPMLPPLMIEIALDGLSVLAMLLCIVGVIFIRTLHRHAR